MKYKVGDKVKIRKDLKEGNVYGGLTLWGGPMASFKGSTLTICKVNTEDNLYYFEEIGFCFSEEMIERKVNMKDSFKVGDRVQIKSWKEMKKEFPIENGNIRTSNGVFFVSNMKHLCGRYATIESIDRNYVELTNWSDTKGDLCWNYTIGMFKKVAKTFTKADLKEGDILTLRNGKTGTYSSNMNIYGLRKDHINKDLTNNGYCERELDIVKVERVKETEVVYERKEEILDEAEKNYLKGVIRPFRDEVKYIVKRNVRNNECLRIVLKTDNIGLPNFEKGSMYKGMEVNEEYTLEELGL